MDVIEHRTALSQIFVISERQAGARFRFKRFMMDMTSLSSGMLNYQTEYAQVRREATAAMELLNDPNRVSL